MAIPSSTMGALDGVGLEPPKRPLIKSPILERVWQLCNACTQINLEIGIEGVWARELWGPA